MVKKKRTNNLELVSFILFILVIISSLLVVNIYAKYFARNEGGNSSSVASFDIDVDVVDGTTSSQTLEYQMTPGAQILLDVNFKGTNNDVKTAYKIMLYTLDNLPLQITYNSNNIETTGISGEINPHSSLSIEDILIEWPNTLDNLDYKYSGEVDMIKVVIEIVQVD